jgi:hypothetical protein
MTALLLLVGGLVLPAAAQAALWLLPGLALAVLGLAGERLVGARTSIAGIAGLWISTVTAARVSTGSVLSVFSPRVQVLSLIIVVAAVAAAVVSAARPRRLL